MSNDNTYKAKVYCSNCDLKKEIDIQRGKKVEETACLNCGTMELSKDINVNLSGRNDYYNNGFDL